MTQFSKCANKKYTSTQGLCNYSHYKFIQQMTSMPIPPQFSLSPGSRKCMGRKGEKRACKLWHTRANFTHTHQKLCRNTVILSIQLIYEEKVAIFIYKLALPSLKSDEKQTTPCSNFGLHRSYLHTSHNCITE